MNSKKHKVIELFIRFILIPVAFSNNTTLLWDMIPATPLLEYFKNGTIESLSNKQKKQHGIENK
ncbi:hypothetical protein [Winogradskyella sp. A2]|uniref:hypothetical protein n=1 Tax=Winogradskyella sp. A2 TaxID=3366944 RepID=UPI00398C3BB7